MDSGEEGNELVDQDQYHDCAKTERNIDWSHPTEQKSQVNVGFHVHFSLPGAHPPRVLATATQKQSSVILICGPGTEQTMDL